MTKKKKILSQPTLFDWVKKTQELAKETRDFPARGSLNINSELRAAVSEDLRHANNPLTGREFSRYEVAGRMSDFVGQEITASMLYNWTAESHENHRFPAEWIPAFVYATGGQRLALEVITRHSGLFALPGPEALRAEIQRIDEEIKGKKEEKQKRLFLLKEIENRK